eukprot:3764270-Alexandrium_andersonii.AAC.1
MGHSHCDVSGPMEPAYTESGIGPLKGEGAPGRARCEREYPSQPDKRLSLSDTPVSPQEEERDASLSPSH